MNPSDTKLLLAQEYLFYNLYNDFILKNGELVKEIYSDIAEKVQKISRKCDILNLISGIIFGCASLILLIMLHRIYSHNKHFLGNFIKGEYHDDLVKLKHTLNQYKHILRGDMSFKFMDSMSSTNNHVKEETNVKSHSNKNKRLHFRFYFLFYFQRFMIIFVCSLAALIIMITANTMYKNRTTEILPVMNDITQVGMLSYETQMTVSEVPVYVLRPDIPIKYMDLDYILTQDIDQLNKITSVENTKFSREFQKKVNENFCPWIQFPRCTLIGKASATQGIIAAIHYLHQALVETMVAFSMLPPGLYRVMALLVDQRTIDLFDMLYYGIVPAINHLMEEKTAALFEILDSGANFIIKYSIVGALIAIFVLISILFYIYPQLSVERKVICQTLLLIPPHMVVRNRLLKEFLLKEAKLFHGFIKDNIEDRGSFILDIATSRETKSKGLITKFDV